jgi:hypothetical protein
VIHTGDISLRAADIYANTVMLVEKVENAQERRRLEEKLRRLRKGLERRSSHRLDRL